MAGTIQSKMLLLGFVVLAGWPASGKAQSWLYGPTVNWGLYLLYLEFAVGPTFVEDATFTTRTFQTSGPTPGLAGPFDINSSFSVGYALGGWIGYGFPNGLWFEEIMYRYNDLDTASISGPRLSGTNLNSINDYNQWVAILTNVIYDWQNSTRFTPYVGVGGGALYVKETTNAQGITPLVRRSTSKGEDRAPGSAPSSRSAASILRSPRRSAPASTTDICTASASLRRTTTIITRFSSVCAIPSAPLPAPSPVPIDGTSRLASRLGRGEHDR